MSISFRPGIRENVGLWVNVIGGTGSGKTYSGFRLASGIAGDKPFAVIDTENRRALHYADQFRFDHAELSAPYRPDMYSEAVAAADAAGYPVIVIDSGSHCWTSVLDWQEEELDSMVKRAKERNDSRSEWQIREAGKMSAWIQPKKSHKQMVQKLLQVRAHIILCLRAEEKIEMVREGNKTVIRPKQTLTGKDGWIPICDKALPFEATCSFLLLAGNPGIPHPIKLQEQHKAIFPLDQPINEESGKRLAAWAAGRQPSSAKATDSPATSTSPTGASPVSGELISPDQHLAITDELRKVGKSEAELLAAMKGAGHEVPSVAKMPASLYERATGWIGRQKKQGALID